MSRVITLTIIIATALTGCDRSIRNEIDITEVPKDKATVIFYAGEESFYTRINCPASIYANSKDLGFVCHGEPLTKELDPGKYTIHTKSIFIDRKSEIILNAGEVYYIRTIVTTGMWMSSITLTQTDRPDRL